MRLSLDYETADLLSVLCECLEEEGLWPRVLTQTTGYGVLALGDAVNAGALLGLLTEGERQGLRVGLDLNP